MLGEQSRFSNNYMMTSVFTEPRGQHDTDLSGVMRHDASGKAWRFQDVFELLKLYEGLFDAEDYPQPTHRLRDMETAGRREDGSDFLRERELGDDKTEGLGEPNFRVKVLYRQNASWQGIIEWPAKMMRRRFQSALELIKIMDSSLSGDETGWERQ